MAIKPILQAPNIKLNTLCKEVEEVNDEIRQLIQDLKDTLESSIQPGAGIAAPQIGVLKRVCLVKKFFRDSKTGEENEKIHVLINPIITKTSKETNAWWEGCLSIKDVWGQVRRPEKIKLEYLDEDGKKTKKNTSGYFARLIQHEIDHLNGILFTSKVEGETHTEKELDKILTA